MPKSFATCLGDIEDAALRSLIGNRSLSSAGLAINDISPQTTTITLGGTKHTGDVITATVNGVDYAYTTLAEDASLSAVATALAALIDADAAVAAAAVGAVITITASENSAAFTATAAVTGTGKTTTATVATTHVSVQSVATTNTLKFCVDGKACSVAATADIPVSGDVQPASTARWFLVSVVAAGTFTVTAGTTGVNMLPPIPVNSAPCGAFKVETGAATTFTPGTTALNAAGVTTTFYNLAVVPTSGHP